MAETKLNTFEQRRAKTLRFAYEVLRDVRFAAVGLVLLIMTVVMQPAAAAAGRWLKKQPVQIRKPLSSLDLGRLNGFRFVEDIGEGSAAAVDTEEYIEWRFVPTEPAIKSTGVLYLHVYYYTEGGSKKALRIPHTPEVCYRQAGHQVTDLSSFKIRVSDPGTDRTLKAKYVRMSHPTDPDNRDICVAYLFCVNGAFYDDREKARLHLAMPWTRVVYFSKIECAVKIPGPDRLDNALEACRRMLARVIPELLQEHFPTPQDIERARR